MQKFLLEKYMVEPENKIAKRVIYQDEKTLAFVLNIGAGETLPEHTHFDCTVLLQVMRGQAEVNVDGKKLAMKEDELLQLEGAEKMVVNNNGENTLVLYVTISPLPPSEDYTVDADI